MVARRGLRFATLTIVSVLMNAAPALAQQVAAVGAVSTEIADGVHLLDGLPCNVVAIAGSEGILLIDNGSTGSADQLGETIDLLASGRVRIAINTHFHFDHVGANERLSENGAVIVAHEGVRGRMQEEWRIPENSLGIRFPIIPPYPATALPMLTFADALTVNFGGHLIELRYFPAAHSDADVVVFLRDANVIHTGDLYLSNGFPVIESFGGGTIDGTIAAVDSLISIVADDTKIVPGHGPVSNRQELREYRYMLSAARDRIAALVEEGKGLEEIVAADPTAGLYTRGESWLSPRLFVWSTFIELTRER